MITRYIIAATFLGIAACATSGTESAEPAVNAGIPEPVSDSTAAESGLDSADVPEVPVSANVPVSKDEIVCRRERRLGSNRSIKICRTRAQIDEDREAGQDTLDNLSRRTYSGADRVSGNQ